MKWTTALAVAFAGTLVAGLWGYSINNRSTGQGPTSFASKLDTRVAEFDGSGRSLVAVALDLSYAYHVPLALQYVDRSSTTQPITMHVRNDTLREIFVGIISQFPDYRVSFSEGLVEIYSPSARADSSNLLNTTIRKFTVARRDASHAEMELYCAMVRETRAGDVCGGSTTSWGAKNITLDMENAKVYRILNAIVSQSGDAVWIVTVPPGKLSELASVGRLWHIYPLEEPFRAAALDALAELHPN
jgi:hypothetical protein